MSNRHCHQINDGDWLYAVCDCATPAPHLVRVQDPFGNLPAQSKGNALIGVTQTSNPSADAA